MAKSSSVFVCQNCGYESPKWMGQCPECEKWNSFEEQVKSSQAAGRSSQKKNTRASEVISFENVSLTGQEFARFSTGMEEFDRVLGGGIVFGSVVLIGGEPGIGKSTLLTHLALNILKDKANARRTNKVLYCAGEESPQQIAIRIKRMSTQFADDSAQAKNLLFSTSTDVDEIIATIEQEKPTLAIVDSIQTMSTQDLTGSQGSIGQLKECTDRLTAC
ncbi:MAG TPA: AAA family ATPase, partial [Patescibacteria group bacterium]|nr:AAA family ATPase [Patescibacteria group bacterium]